MCIINHLKISFQNLVIYHTKMIARLSTPRDFFTEKTVRFSYFLLLTWRTMPWRRSLGHALGRVSIFLCENYRNGASKNEGHRHIKTSIIFSIYHIEKIVIPFKKSDRFKMIHLKIKVIIISKLTSYSVVICGQHDGILPGVHLDMSKALIYLKR